MQRHEFGPVRENPETLRHVLAFMGRTASFEKDIVSNEDIPFGSPEPFAGRDRQIILQGELNSSYALINDMLREIGGIRYPVVNLQTGRAATVILDSWYGLAPARPGHQQWRSGNLFFMIQDSFLGDLQSLLEPDHASAGASLPDGQ